MGRTSALVALGVANAWNVGRWAARGAHIIILRAQATFIEIAWKALEGRLLWAPVLQTPKKKLYSSFWWRWIVKKGLSESLHGKCSNGQNNFNYM